MGDDLNFGGVTALQGVSGDLTRVPTPSPAVTQDPTQQPTRQPTQPTNPPTQQPTKVPVIAPTRSPTQQPVTFDCVCANASDLIGDTGCEINAITCTELNGQGGCDVGVPCDKPEADQGQSDAEFCGSITNRQICKGNDPPCRWKRKTSKCVVRNNGRRRFLEWENWEDSLEEAEGKSLASWTNNLGDPPDPT